MKKFSFYLFVILGLFSCTGGGRQNSTAASKDEPATWIADRHIKGMSFVSDVRDSLPANMIDNAVAQEIKRRTGITLEWEYLSGSSLKALSSSLATGNLGEIFIFYLNNSSRPEFPVLYKAASEGVLTDVAPYLKQSKVYRKYFDKDFLPIDTEKNIVFRKEWGGRVYLVHMGIDEKPNTGTMDPDRDYFGGLYIKKSIADSLGIDVKSINTLDDFYQLLRKIKEGDFKDKNGRPVVPLGPSPWGGYRTYYMAPIRYVDEFDGWKFQNGNFIHKTDTDFPERQIEFTQKLLREGLMHKEYFTIDSSRAKELAYSGSSAIVGDTHNRTDFILDEDYIPIVLQDENGEKPKWYARKSAYAGWAIPATAKKPEEIVKFIDFLASKEGKALWMYGIEGENYEVRAGKFYVSQDILTAMKGDRRKLMDLNIYAGGQGSGWAWGLGNTDLNNFKQFGEEQYGSLAMGKTVTKSAKIFNEYYAKMLNPRVYEGLKVNAFLASKEEFRDLQDLLQNKYNDMMIEAFYQKDFAAGKTVLDNYRALLQKAGMDEFKRYIKEIYKENPKLLIVANL